jgi:hypothetical protein
MTHVHWITTLEANCVSTLPVHNRYNSLKFQNNQFNYKILTENQDLPETITTNVRLVVGANKINVIEMKTVYLRSYNHVLFIFLHIWSRSANWGHTA